MSSSNSMADIGSLLGATSTTVPKNSTSRANNTDLSMQDFLQLMVVQLQNQTMDDTMDTSEMMNQMVQMQMVTAITNMTEASVMSYASSLVGKVVTVGISAGNSLEEREILVMGTGVLNGQQVIFGSDGETYALNQIMAVGRLPDENGKYPGINDGTTGEEPDGDNGTGEVGGTTGGSGENTGSGSTGGVTGGESAGGDSSATETAAYNGEQGAPTDGVG